MLCRIAMLLSLVVCSAALTAFAADADCEAIKRAIVLDSAIKYEDLRKIGAADRPPKPDDCEDQSLTFMLFVFVVACLGKPDPADMKVYCPTGKETFDDDETTEEAPS